MNGEHPPSVLCSKCGTPLPDENPSTMPPPDKRTPCPRCGSTARTVNAYGTGGISFSGSAVATLILHSERLLETANELLTNGQYGLAVVVAHTAYEVGVERALGQAMRAKGIGHLEDAIDGLLGNFNLGNGKVHKFFTALTGETVTDKPFWKGLTDSVQRRNAIVHRGLEVTKQEAEFSLQAAADLVVWLKGRFG
jgi:hypothetical protein